MRRDTVIMWFRRDLRLVDNPALVRAAQRGRVMPLFVLDDRLWRPAGAARQAFLVGCLRDLDRAVGGHLVLRRGDPRRVLPALATETGATGVVAAADFGPYGRRRDDAVADRLKEAGAPLELVGSPYAVEPGSVRKPDGEPYSVFTPFYRAWTAHGWDRPHPRPGRVSWVAEVDSDPLPDAPDPTADLPEAGERAAWRAWERFLDEGLHGYAAARDRPDLDATSRLSPYLKWGCLHPRTLLEELDAGNGDHERFRSELCWREFYAEVLWQRPDTVGRCYQSGLQGMMVDEGEEADERFAAWAEGRTGFPIVDAGMRQLRTEGWMHNRVRMITASFLVKDLHLDWGRGARHFMRYLVDGDLASNTHGWQWVAGCGTDAAPYFRVFNPVTQGKKFDPAGDYIRRYVPELAGLGPDAVHEPWAGGGQLPLGGGSYPAPIVDHAEERREALRRYQQARGG